MIAFSKECNPGIIKGGHRLLKLVITFESAVVDVANLLNVRYKIMAEEM